MPVISNKEVIEFYASRYMEYLFFEVYDGDEQKVNEAFGHFLNGLFFTQEGGFEPVTRQVKVEVYLKSKRCAVKFKEEEE